jgi:hypothetical protein
LKGSLIFKNHFFKKWEKLLVKLALGFFPEPADVSAGIEVVKWSSIPCGIAV